MGKVVIILLLVGIVTVSCLPKRGGGRGKGKPCKGNGGIESCICTDESTCDSKADCRANCGKRSDNPIVSCTCADGASWTCNGVTYEGRDEKKSCDKDEIEYCTCDDGS